MREIPHFAQRHREIPEQVTPATVVEVDRTHVTPVKQVIFLMQVAVNKPESLRYVAQRPLRLPRPADRLYRDRRGVAAAHVGDGVLDVFRHLRRGVAQPPPDESLGWLESQRMRVQTRHETANTLQVPRGEAGFQEPSLDPPQEHADSRLWHTLDLDDGEKSPEPVWHRLGHYEISLAAKNGEPGQFRLHLRCVSPRVPRITTYPVDAQHVGLAIGCL